VTRVLRGGSAAEYQTAPIVALHEMPLLGEDGRRMESAIAEARQAAFREGREAGYRDGFEAGAAEARRQVEEKGRRNLVPAMLALEQATADLRARDAVVFEQIEPELIGLVLAIVEAVIGRELETVDAPVRDALIRALTFAPDRGPVRVFVHADDLETIGSVDELVPGRTVELVADPSIERGGCVVLVGACRVDAQVGPALERVRGVLRTVHPDTGHRIDHQDSLS